MNINRSGFFWGILLIGAGALALAGQLGYIERSSPWLWIAVFVMISLAALVSYALSGWKQWGWLFPAGVFAGLAVTVALASSNIDSAIVASPIFFGLVIPFAAAYLKDRSRNWWALIPGGVMVFLALTTLLVNSTKGDEWVGALFLFMIALSFLMVYLNNRTRLWALLVAYINAVLGIGPLMATGGRDAAYYGPIFLLAVALAFYVVYFRSTTNWWAIIPAGAVMTIAIVAALSTSGIVAFAWEEAFMTALLMVGLSAT